VILAIVPTHAWAESVKQRLAVSVSGVEEDVYRNVLAHLSLSAASKKKEMLSETAARQLYERADAEIKTALQAFGYYQPKVQATFEKDKKWKVDLKVSPGPQTLLREVMIEFHGEGRENEKFTALLQESGLKSGTALLHDNYTTFKSALENTAYELGYLDAKYRSHEIKVYPIDQAADVALHFDTGPRYFFGSITIQQETLEPEFIARYVKAKAGDPFETRSLVNLQLRLTETNYFDRVRIDIQREQSIDRHIPVTIVASPRKPSAYNFSAGFGTDTGPRLGVQADYRRVNSKGHRFHNQLEVSAVQSSLVSQYLIPIDDVSSEYVDFTANVEHERVNDVDSVQYRIGTSINENRWGGRSRLGLEYLAENWSFGDESNESAVLLIPSVEFTRKQSDNTFFPTRGYSYTARLLGGVDSVLSDVTFAQVQLFAKAVFPVTARSRLLLRSEIAATESDNFNALPPSLRFYAGGAASVRGYGYKDLSPTDSAGNLIGGKYLTTISAEIDYLVVDNFGLAAFVDAGDATDNPFDSFSVGAGLGLRYRSPAGMLRLDIAHPFDDPDNDFRIHISFGIDL
jgi:translocation and assembly module TamA